MNKSTITNVIAGLLILLGLTVSEQYKQPILNIGLFALSGAITNWLAIHMLFEKVPFLYGSGVIPERFEDFKRGIQSLIMNQFFTKENYEKFFDGNQDESLNFDSIIEEIDMNPAFDAMVGAIEESSFASMLSMFGGTKVLEGLRKPFVSKIKISLKKIAQSDLFQQSVKTKLGNSLDHSGLHEKVEHIVEKRLDELTPQMVKEIIQNMIKHHLGWLVVWGGVFGGLIGLITTYLPFWDV